MAIIDSKIRDEKLQYNINREAAKISELSSAKNDKYEYLTGEEILLFYQRQITVQAKFVYCSSGKAFETQTEKQVGATKSLDPCNKLKRIESIILQNLMNKLILDYLNEIIELQDIIKKDDLNYKLKRRRTYDFCKYSVPTGFLRDIHEVHLLIEAANISKLILLMN